MAQNMLWCPDSPEGVPFVWTMYGLAMSKLQSESEMKRELRRLTDEVRALRSEMQEMCRDRTGLPARARNLRAQARDAGRQPNDRRKKRA